MKHFFNFLFFCLPHIILCQTFSGQSSEHVFQIPENKSFSSISEPIDFKLRQDFEFSGVSQPVNFNIGKKIIETKSLVTIAEKPNMQETLIPDLETNLPKYYSLFIGVNDYQYKNERLLNLNKPASDASDLQKILTSQFSFQGENSFLLINPSRQEIFRHLEKLASLVSSKDNLLIFYAGHGVWDERLKVGYWLPSDAKTDDKSSWISNSTIRDYISGINSKHTLLISDACFSGSIFKTRDVDLSDFGMLNLYRLQSRKAMTSGTLTTVPDESKFMFYFMKRLRETEGKYLSARQLFFALETAVLNNTSTVPQFGVIQDTGDEGGDFIFIRK